MNSLPIPSARYWPPRGVGADRLIAATMVVFTVIEVGAADMDRGAAIAALGIVVAISAAWRRTRPLVAVAVGMGAYCLLAVVDVATDDLNSVTMVLILLVYSVAMWAPIRPAIAGLVLASAAISALILNEGKGIGDYLYAAVLLGGTWGIGRAMRARLLQVASLAAVAATAELERQQAAAAAVAAERNRIARELHDIVSHGLSVMVVQAAAAESAVDDAPADAVVALRSIQDVGRDAQTEMVRLLDVLHAGADGRSLAPTPGIDDVSALVERMRATGLAVEFTRDGEPQVVPAGVGLAAYRVVQEALTNVRRHAGSVATAVRLVYSPSRVRVVVSNARGSAPPSPGAGHGLVGMRERVAMCGGTLTAEPSADGGFVVTADLPCTGA